MDNAIFYEKDYHAHHCRYVRGSLYKNVLLIILAHPDNIYLSQKPLKAHQQQDTRDDADV